jgi:hypothetical protein
MPQGLNQRARATAEHEDVARKRVAAKALLHQQRQAIHTFPHVGVAAGNPNPHTLPQPGSSPLQYGEHSSKRGRIDASVDDDATVLSDLDHHAAARSRAGFSCDCLGSSNHRPHEAVLDIRAYRLGPEGAPPRHQQ